MERGFSPTRPLGTLAVTNCPGRTEAGLTFVLREKNPRRKNALMTPYREYKRLSSTCRNVTAVSWEGTVFRNAAPRHASARDLVAGRGARRRGGRWNAPATMNTVYASTTPETALAEALRQVRTAGIPDAEAMPRVLAAMRVRADRALDLTDPVVHRALGLSRAHLVNCDWERANEAGKEALTQALGRAAFEAGFKALIVPSAATPDGTNIVVFPARLEAGDRLAVLNAAKLPAQKRSP